MAQIPNKIKQVIDTYIESLQVNQIPIESAFLFGSYAKGKYNDLSDIDIALVSNIFEGRRISDRSKIRRITLSVSSDLEVIPFNPKDFTLDNPFAREIIETGVRII